MRIAVTGGAGFIGSNLVEKLLEEHDVTVIDNLSSGQEENVPEAAELLETDIKQGVELEGFDSVFHLAANPKVNTFPGDREKDFDENLAGTKKVLDSAADAEIDNLVFASSSVVYGEDAEIPTPEDHPKEPISMYGATKIGGEQMCRVYAHTFDFELSIVRLANIVGERNRKGVIYDFVQKLRENPEELEILGNGKQKKSYLHVDDTVEGIIAAWKNPGVYNIGNEDSTSVDEIADIVSEEMGLSPEYSYTGGEKGWTGDVPEMRLAIEKLKNTGWKPSISSNEAVRKTVQELL
ncbi:MAG: NAD-dependent epimerase/dehydratase family protein [Candidatus Nanohaloarchaea archaeon]